MSYSLEGELAGAEALIQHLLMVGERDKAALARKLHDHITELIVAAVMDLSAAAPHLSAANLRAQEQLRRAKDSLNVAIDQSRRLVEELRPSLVDEIGLFTALRWQVQRASYGKNVIYTEQYPEIEPPLSADASIALFRIAEEALEMTFKRGEVDVADLHVHIAQGHLHMKFTDNGIPSMLNGAEQGAAMSLASMRYRLLLLGGSVEVERTSSGETVLRASLPLNATE